MSDTLTERICPNCKKDISDKRAQAEVCSRKCRKQMIFRLNRFRLWRYLLAHPCVECGENDPVLLDFDHLDPKTKKQQISRMMFYSWATIEKEIAKCRVLCVKCHRRKTARQLGWYTFEDWKKEWIKRSFASSRQERIPSDTGF